jgi:hypothetical protein
MSFAALAFGALLVSSPVDSQEVRLFNGRDLTGWTALGGGKWTVENGVIKGRSTPDQPQGLLLWKDPVKDFTARCKFRITEGDSGFYFRTERVDNEVLVHGFQVEVDTSFETGGIYETGGRGWVHKPDFSLHDQSGYKPGEWTDLQVTAIGTQYIIRVNGTRITVLNDPQGRTEGRLALQLHGAQNMDVEYKDIYVRPIG